MFAARQTWNFCNGNPLYGRLSALPHVPPPAPPTPIPFQPRAYWMKQEEAEIPKRTEQQRLWLTLGDLARHVHMDIAK